MVGQFAHRPRRTGVEVIAAKGAGSHIFLDTQHTGLLDRRCEPEQFGFFSAQRLSANVRRYGNCRALSNNALAKRIKLSTVCSSGGGRYSKIIFTVLEF